MSNALRRDIETAYSAFSREDDIEINEFYLQHLEYSISHVLLQWLHDRRGWFLTSDNEEMYLKLFDSLIEEVKESSIDDLPWRQGTLLKTLKDCEMYAMWRQSREDEPDEIDLETLDSETETEL